MIIKKEEKNGILIITVKANKTDTEMEKMKNTLLKPHQIDYIVKEDADVYADDGKLLLKFRKGKLSAQRIEAFYDNVIAFAQKSYSTNRGSASGSNKKNVYDNPKVFSNIIGYMDSFSPKQKFLLKQQNKSLKYNARECRFNVENPEKYQKMIPLVQEIDRFYKQLQPDHYKKQVRKAQQTHFRIPKTAFTTITTNVNFQTSVHKDKGDDEEGFGNLSVIDTGKYSGAETCIPKYGIGVDVRRGDILFMDVHEWHGNLPMIKKSDDAMRLSIVCYLRYNVWKHTRNVSKKQMIRHNTTVKSIKQCKKK